MTSARALIATAAATLLCVLPATATAQPPAPHTAVSIAETSSGSAALSLLEGILNAIRCGSRCGA